MLMTVCGNTWCHKTISHVFVATLPTNNVFFSCTVSVTVCCIQLYAFIMTVIIFLQIYISHFFSPLISTWPHLRCDVGLEEGEYKWKLSLCYSVVYYYNGAQRYEQFLQVCWLYRALILLGLALCLPSASVSSDLMVLYRYYKNFFAYIRLFTF